MSQPGWESGDWLKDKTAIVIGGSRGIGRAVAGLFCAHGARVAIASRDTIVGAAAAQDLISARYYDTFYEHVDVANPDKIEGMTARIIRRLGYSGAINVLVNCAGILQGGSGTNTRIHEWDKLQAVNTRGTWLCIQSLLPHMADGGSIINSCSIDAYAGTPNQLAYAVSKSGIEAMTRNLAIELGERGIRVNAVAPGLVDTDMTAGMDSAQRNRILDNTALACAATPELIAGTYLFLASEASAFITGQTIRVDGGRGFDI